MNLRGGAIHEILTIDALPAWLAAYGSALDGIMHTGANSVTAGRNVDPFTQRNNRGTLDPWDAATRPGTHPPKPCPPPPVAMR